MSSLKTIEILLEKILAMEVILKFNTNPVAHNNKLISC